MSSASATMSNDEAAIRSVIESVGKAHQEKNAEGIVAPYASDAVIYSLAPPLRHVGMETKQIQAWLDTWEGPVEREARDLTIQVTGGFALAHGYYRLGGTPKSAGPPISFWLRATVALRREGNGWQIVHEHTSVPFYMDGSLRPAFDLQP